MKHRTDKDEMLLQKASLDIPLVEENADDVQLATTVRFHSQLGMFTYCWIDTPVNCLSPCSVGQLKEKRHALKLQSIFNSKNGSSHLLYNKRLVDHRNFRSIGEAREEAPVRFVRKRKHSQLDDVTVEATESEPSVEAVVELEAKSLVSNEYGSSTDSES